MFINRYHFCYSEFYDFSLIHEENQISDCLSLDITVQVRFSQGKKVNCFFSNGKLAAKVKHMYLTNKPDISNSNVKVTRLRHENKK